MRALIVGLLLTLTPAAASAATPIVLDVRDADVVDVIRLIGTQGGVNVVADGSIKHDRISLRLRGVSFDEALATLATAYDLQIRRQGQVLFIGTAASMNRRFAGSLDALGTQTATFPLRNARAEEIARPLADALVPGTIVVADHRTGSIIISGAQSTIERARQLLAAFDAPAIADGGVHGSEAIPLRFIRATEAMKLMKGAIPDGSAVADDRQNAIIALGGSESIGAIRGVLRDIDKPARQVMFEVKVIDLQPVNDVTKVGIELGGVDFSGQPLADGATYAFTRGSLALNARLNFLVQTGGAKILATPRLVTTNNHEASLLIGQSYPIIYFDIRSGNQQIQNIDVGVKLRMTPTIGSDGSITAELHPEYSEIQTFVQNYPVVANRRVDSTLLVRDGETIVLGGLIRDVESETITKLPGLGNIPILGDIFKSKEKNHQKDEVVFLITPHIIDGASPAK